MSRFLILISTFILTSCMGLDPEVDFYFNSSRIHGIDSSKVSISFGHNLRFDTVIYNSGVDTYRLLTQIKSKERQQVEIKIQVNGRDTTIVLPKINNRSKLYFTYDNTFKLREKVLLESSLVDNRDRGIQKIKDSLYMIEKDFLDTIMLEFDAI